MSAHHHFLPATPLAPSFIPLPFLPYNPRIECGHHAGGATGKQESALTARLHRIYTVTRWRRARNEHRRQQHFL